MEESHSKYDLLEALRKRSSRFYKEALVVTWTSSVLEVDP